MHCLLLRQINRYLGSPDEIPENRLPFLEAISASYVADDSDRSLIDHSLDVMSTEPVSYTHLDVYKRQIDGKPVRNAGLVLFFGGQGNGVKIALHPFVVVA